MSEILGPAEIILGAFLMLVAVIGLYSKNLTRRLQCQDEYIRIFYEDSSKLVSDDAVPEALVSLIESMHRHVRDSSTVRHLLWYGILGRLRNVDPPTRERMKTLSGQIAALNKGQKVILANVFVAFLLSGTYSSMFLGPIVRRLMLYAASLENGASSKDPEIWTGPVVGGLGAT